MKNQILNYATLVIIVIAIPAMIFYVGSSIPIDAVTVLGIALTFMSYILLIIARLQLGKSFSISAQAHVLVTGGLYSKIRHPIYFFGQFLILGITLCLKNPLFLLFWAFVIIMQIQRAKREERVLEEKFGDAYREYKKTTWF